MTTPNAKMLAYSITINVKHALRVVPVTEENSRLLDILDQINTLASQIENEEE